MDANFKVARFSEIYGPRWYGYSAGKWEGDTFVADPVGLDERTWLDNLGYPRTDLVKNAAALPTCEAGHLGNGRHYHGSSILHKAMDCGKGHVCLASKGETHI
jgi:hypothetical protein